MPSLEQWDPFTKHVQGGLREGNFVNSQFVVVCAGPPFWAQMTGNVGGLTNQAATAGLPVYPIGTVQSFSMGQSKAISRVFEIGSDRAYFISGRSVGSVQLGRILYHGPSLLRALWAYYDTSNDTNKDGYPIQSLLPSNEVANIGIIEPLSNGTNIEVLAKNGSAKSIKIPPGYDNLFCNLASDLFSQPIGLLLMLRDNAGSTYGAFYLEQCYVPSQQWGFEANGMVVSETVSIQYERLVPVQVGSIKTLRDVGVDTSQHAPDVTGGYNAGGRITF